MLAYAAKERLSEAWRESRMKIEVISKKEKYLLRISAMSENIAVILISHINELCGKRIASSDQIDGRIGLNKFVYLDPGLLTEQDLNLLIAHEKEIVSIGKGQFQFVSVPDR